MAGSSTRPESAASVAVYLGVAQEFYDQLADAPQLGSCCVQRNDLELPGLTPPPGMTALAFSCGTTVHPSELADAPTVLYVGVGGGLEALQFAYFSRRSHAVIAVDPAPRMRRAAAANLAAAASLNDWFDPSFVQVLEGDACRLPLPDASVDLVAQNCLFNIFEPRELQRALAEAARVLRPGGRLMMSDPIATREIPAHLRQDDRLRAMCLSGAYCFEAYTDAIGAAGFGRIEVRTRKPYRILERATYGMDADLVLDALDTVSYKVAGESTSGKAAVFTGRRAIYIGDAPQLVLDAVTLQRHVPAAVSDLEAERLQLRSVGDVLLTPSTWRYVPPSLATGSRR